MNTPRTEECRQAYIDRPLESGHDLLVWKLAETLELELAEMTARAVSLALHLPPDTLAGDVQRWRDEAKLLLANS